MPNYDKTTIGTIILEEAAQSSVIDIIDEGNTTEDMVIQRSNGPSRVTALAVLQDADRENRNKRCYALSDLRREVYGDRITELVKHQQLKGEAGHPLSDSVVRQQTIDPKLVCVNHIKVWIDKDLVKCHCRGTNNEYGNAFDQDLRAGETPAFSLRALGNIENINGRSYVKNLRIITWDHVCYPSHARAYTQEVLTESAMEYSKKSKLQALMNNNYIRERVMADGMDNTKNIDYASKYKEIAQINETGKITTITGKDAYNLLDRLQRESASIGSILETFEGIANEVKLVNNKIRLTTAYGEVIYLPLQEHVQNLILDYAYHG